MWDDPFLGKDDNLRACLKQYGLETRYLDMLVADASQSVWREEELFDAIVTDRELSSIITLMCLYHAPLSTIQLLMV